MRTNFDYRNATVAEIVEKFKTSSKQLIYAIRKNYKDDAMMSEKIEQSYRLYKFAVLDEKLSAK